MGLSLHSRTVVWEAAVTKAACVAAISPQRLGPPSRGVLPTPSFAGRPMRTGLSPLSCAWPPWPRRYHTVTQLTGTCGAAVPSRRQGRHWRNSAELSHDGPPTSSCHKNNVPTAAVASQRVGPLQSPQHRVIARKGTDAVKPSCRRFVIPPHACETAARVASLYSHARDDCRIVVPLRGGP